MGISANHARLLALTARKCDLETQMQVLLNSKLKIAQETSRIADQYNEAISNRKLFIFKPVLNNAPIIDGEPTQSIYQSLSGQNLYNTGGLLLVEKSGATYTQVTTIPTPAVHAPTPEEIEERLRNGTYYLVQAATLQTQDPKTVTFAAASYLGGGISLSTDTTTNTKWEIVDWRSSTQILDQLDKSDDDTAKASYEKSMNDLKEKESEMDVEVNEIETQHSAISNELEATKKVMTKNTEDSFKYFS